METPVKCSEQYLTLTDKNKRSEFILRHVQWQIENLGIQQEQEGISVPICPQ